MMTSRQHVNLFFFDGTLTDLDRPLVNDRFDSVGVEFVGLIQIHALIIVLSKSDNCFPYVLSKFDNYVDRATVDLNWPFNHW